MRWRCRRCALCRPIEFFGSGNSSSLAAQGNCVRTARQLTQSSIGGRPIKRLRFDISPRGTAIVYPDLPAGQTAIALFLLNLETMKSRQLTFPLRESAFSHDGKTIAFGRDVLDLWQVYAISSDGSNERALTENWRVDIEGLAWSSDDKDILLGGPQLRPGLVGASRTTDLAT
jgi:hypothetical protein